ncbi:unnamed protein product [Vitrella brassicaformis CCMP3155]|uniref:SAM-dependent MTase RsmB/NOP-type domain-containing protein n=2 Tax=Vitrella brassicaformis TaxID=1169539 RepID=A0A0G4FHY6_VITBC|nr:unnamed protein product [Vitrella brassicaformis CCMP3155]|mmetsp:Transcript_14580/g.42018  ORF Transcript_14580/g.42018 Transcript_14580/m.42018 type:complete len:384 (+) Transcript_14580:39-1190(+)|eukprot:CEM12941.1 unnamed protein product [Vitrella brassicaformis CCMP3155]
MNAFRVRHLENALLNFEQVTSLKQPLDLHLKRYFQAHRQLGSADRAWICTQIYELVRWRGLLDYVTPPPSTWSSRLRTFFISDRWRAHTMNPRLPPHIRCSFPEALFRRIENALGTKKAIQVCNVLNEAPPTFLRVNTNQITRDRVYKFLQSKGVDVEKCVNSPYGLMLNHKQRLLDLPEYKQGLIEIQDEASQIVSFKVQAMPGDKVLDYCAGSGGKTLAFGPQMENSGKIYLHDAREYMLNVAKIRLRKAGITNYVLLPPSHPHLSRLQGQMDWVVCDVPSTATGALRRNPDIKWNYSDARLFELVGQQREIFEQALGYMKPDKGRIVYVTCSVLDEENVQQLKYFCQKHGLVMTEPPFHALPQTKGMDGFFCATMERRQD